ncbi:MAG: hypothetical protein JWN50_80 [Parcubacteria group bacterium]|nr:hypothetical protein [Parcubacteria group bacterium]
MTKISSAIFSIYIACLLYVEVPYVKTLTVLGKDSSGLFWNHLAVFLIFFILAFFTLGKHIASYGSGAKTFLAGLLLIGLIITVFYHIVPIAPVYKIPSLLDPYFSTDTAFTAWLIAPLALLIFI